jgi:6-phosphogluconolactonase
MTVDVRSARDAESLARDAAAFILESAVTAVHERGRCCLAVSGGSTPAKLFAALAELEMPWSDVHVFQVDERIAPLGDADRNLGDLAANLLERVPIPWRNVHLMPVDAADPAGAARAVDDDLERTCAGVLDVVHLGLGDDGHTASWPPGHAEVATWTSDVGMTTPFNGRSRLTLTPRAVNRARGVLWLVSGEAKAPLVTRLLAGDSTIPAGLVTVERQVLFADAAALP